MNMDAAGKERAIWRLGGGSSVWYVLSSTLLPWLLLLLAPRPLAAYRYVKSEKTIGHYGKGIGEFRYITCVALGRGGEIVVSDWKNEKVERYDPATGRFLGPVTPKGKAFEGPVGLAFDDEYNLYVVEQRGCRIRKFSPAGEQIAVFGGIGIRKGRFRDPRGIACHDGKLYVADFNNRRIQILDTEGRFLREVVYVDITTGRKGKPRGVAVDPKGRLWAVYTHLDRVVRFDENYAPDLIIGTSGKTYGKFNQPRYCAFDCRGCVYVTDYKNHRIQKFDERGRFIYAYGVPGRNPGQLRYPEGITLDTAGNIYVCDNGNNRLQIFKLRREYVLANLGYWCLGRGDIRGARKYYEQLLELQPAHLEAIESLKSCYFALLEEARRQHRNYRARELCDRILALTPSDGRALRTRRALTWELNRRKVYYAGLALGIVITLVFLGATLVTIIREGTA